MDIFLIWKKRHFPEESDMRQWQYLSNANYYSIGIDRRSVVTTLIIIEWNSRSDIDFNRIFSASSQISTNYPKGVNFIEKWFYARHNFHQLVVNDVLIGLYLKISLEFIYYISEGIRVYEQQDK